MSQSTKYILPSMILITATISCEILRQEELNKETAARNDYMQTQRKTRSHYFCEQVLTRMCSKLLNLKCRDIFKIRRVTDVSRITS
jgi:hypothetical protein